MGFFLFVYSQYKLKINNTQKQTIMHALSGSIRVSKSESFKLGNKTYVASHHIARIFNGRGRKSVNSFDKDDFIIHPTKGKLVCFPGKVVRTEG